MVNTRTIVVKETTATRIQKAKYAMGHRSADETINAILDIVEKIEKKEVTNLNGKYY